MWLSIVMNFQSFHFSTHYMKTMFVLYSFNCLNVFMWSCPMSHKSSSFMFDPQGGWRTSTKGQLTPWTMTSDHGRWPFYGVTWWSNFLKNHFTKPLDPSLGVNQTWTKRNDHAAKVNVLVFLNICQKKAVLKRKRKTRVWPFSYLLLSSSSLPQKNISIKQFITSLMCHGPLPFSTRALLLPLPPQNPLDRVSE